VLTGRKLSSVPGADLPISSLPLPKE